MTSTNRLNRTTCGAFWPPASGAGEPALCLNGIEPESRPGAVTETHRAKLDRVLVDVRPLHVQEAREGLRIDQRRPSRDTIGDKLRHPLRELLD